MENKNWKYIKRNNSTISLTDIQLEYLREHGHYPKYQADYVLWLEEKLIEHIKLKRQFIPWELINK